MKVNNYDVIVVGGGIAGLTSAAYLSRSGFKTLLIEKNEEVGGLVSSFERDGFHFDAGVRALVDAGIIRPMLKDLKIDLDFIKSPVSVGIEDRILHIENERSLEKYRELLVHFFPENASDIDNIIQTIKKIMKHMDVLYGIENPAFKDLKKDKSFLFKTLLPWLPKFIFTVNKINSMNMPVEDYLMEETRNQSLIDIIAQHFFKNTPAFFALSYFSLYLDYIYPVKGVGQISLRLKDKILESGGEIKTETKIIKARPADRIVIDQDNNEYNYENLIWAADLKTLYKIIDIDGLPEDTRMGFEKNKEKILKERGGDSVFSLLFEIDEPPETFQIISHGHFFYTPYRMGLGDTKRSDLKNLLENFEKTNKEEIFSWLDRFIKLNTFEISIPCLKNKELAPPNKTGMIVSFLAEYDLFKKIEKAGWLDLFVSEIEKRVIRTLSDSIYPGLDKKLMSYFSFSPLSIESRNGSSEGAITGWAFQESMPVINKIQNVSKSIFTPIPFVYQAGQWTYSPAGVPMCILTGKLAAERIEKTSFEGRK